MNGSRPGESELTDIEPTSKADLMNSFDEMVTDPRLRLDELLVHLEGSRRRALPRRVPRDDLERLLGPKAVFVYDRAGWIGIGGMFFRRSDWTDAAAAAEASPSR